MRQDNTDRSATQGDACQSKNRRTAEAQQLREKSAFIHQVTSFAEYMQKEFTDDSNGYMADELRRLRRRLRWTYGAAAFCGLWTLALIALQFIFGGSGARPAPQDPPPCRQHQRRPPGAPQSARCRYDGLFRPDGTPRRR